MHKQNLNCGQHRDWSDAHNLRCQSAPDICSKNVPMFSASSEKYKSFPWLEGEEDLPEELPTDEAPTEPTPMDVDSATQVDGA